jgi:gluconokinase
MRAGIPLDDDDRHPWLVEIGSKLKEAQDRGGSMIVACSALKRRYRDRLRAGAPGLVFMHLAGDADVLAQRVAARGHEFMPGSLLASQLSALEPLGEDEQGVLLNVRESPSALVDRACDALAREPVPGRF